MFQWIVGITRIDPKRLKSSVYRLVFILRCFHFRPTNSYLLNNEERLECIPCNSNYSLKHVLLDWVDVSDVRQNFYNVNNLCDLFTNVVCPLRAHNWNTIYLIYLEYMLYIYILGYKSISFKNFRIVSPATFVNKSHTLLKL
jgi:hypothetical protein